MVNLFLIESIISFVSIFIAYIISATLVGAFRAWVAKKMGDPTGQERGLLTFNPLVHIEPIGIFLLLYLGVGWGRRVPIDPTNIHAPHRGLKLIAAYFAESFLYFVLGLVSLVMLIGFFGPTILELVFYLARSSQTLPLSVAELYPSYGSLVLSLAFILFQFVYLNILLGALSFIIDGCKLAIAYWADEIEEGSSAQFYLSFALPLFLVFFLAGPLRLFWLNLIIRVGYSLACIFCLA